MAKFLEVEYEGDNFYPEYIWFSGERYVILDRPIATFQGGFGGFHEYDLTMRLCHYPLQEPPKPKRKRRTALSLGLRRPE